MGKVIQCLKPGQTVDISRFRNNPQSLFRPFLLVGWDSSAGLPLDIDI